ncbi:MAG: LuxR C-terminal-related transcriptional regulator [Coriobacteriales bacterium]|jgi:DNA-binding CsgD family transcriptional regulator|nr:LuxR C-terminal-related transcriptional regulator [Coriobacteriales bacterium]
MSSNGVRKLGIFGLERESLSGLLILALGLAMTRSGLVVAHYSSYDQSGNEACADGSALLSVAVLWLLALALALSRSKLTSRHMRTLAACCVTLQALSLFALVVTGASASGSSPLRMACFLAQSVSASGMVLFWLRQIYLSNTVLAAIIIFLSLGISELWLCFCLSFAVDMASVLAAAGIIIQIPLLLALRRRSVFEHQNPLQNIGGFSLEHRLLFDRRFLAPTVVALALVALALGILRGSPITPSLPLFGQTHIMHMIILVALASGAVLLSLRLGFWNLIIVFWIAITTLIFLALVATTTFSVDAGMGKVVTTAATAAFTAFSWYLVVLIMASGKKYDPYVYALGVGTVWTACQSIARLLLAPALPTPENTILVIFLVAFLLVMATQVFFMRLSAFALLVLAPSFPAKPTSSDGQDKLVKDKQAERESQACPLKGKQAEKRPDGSVTLGRQDRPVKDEQPNNRSKPRLPVRQGVQVIGERYLLTEREIEVLRLYSLGFTQKRVAEELIISIDTVHAHIKNIYRKTNLHSRQDILDHIEAYPPPVPNCPTKVCVAKACAGDLCVGSAGTANTCPNMQALSVPYPRPNI